MTVECPQSLSERSLAAEPSVNQSHRISFENTLAWVALSTWYSNSLRAGRSRDQIPVEVRFLAPVQTGSEAHPASYTMGTGSFLGVKRPGRGIDHPPLSSAEVKERVQPYLYSPSGPSWPVLGCPLPLHLPHYTNKFDMWLSTVLQLVHYGPLTHSPYPTSSERNNPLANDWQQTLIHGRTIKFVNSPPCACHGSTGQKP